jgi:hypothetical protein
VWEQDLHRQIRAAVADGDLPRDTDPDQLVYELSGVILALNHALQLHRDQAAPARARKAVRRLLGTATLLLALHTARDGRRDRLTRAALPAAGR